MAIIHLLVDEDYIQEFVNSLPRDKVRIIEKEFEENKQLYRSVLEEYKNEAQKFKPYSDSMQNFTTWFKEKIK